ncbi:hypothetical protein MFLO_16020 [Listeria floridensis FSL S10-1187]|uniref:Uncharacterized protein n=1 Tax=Listeria floridensis FSL S10-1187 TaxID=1265817 RepID=A0ABP3AUY7_9LIST|nr:hypothetical protein [Listeria floridensis]EUJ23369.1 hypothetical protein MFLO_16020 [Listeria floridensis FSL S10-1187]
MKIGPGDLVKVQGYSGVLYYVDSITEQKITSERGYTYETVYDLTSTAGEYEIGFDDDVTLVCRADKADEYLKTGKLTVEMELANADAPTKKLTTSEQVQKIDELLDEALFNIGAYEATGLPDFKVKEKAAYKLIDQVRKGVIEYGK